MIARTTVDPQSISERESRAVAEGGPLLPCLWSPLFSFAFKHVGLCCTHSSC